MRLIFTESAWVDYQWFLTHDRRLLKRINSLIKDVIRSPFDGIRKPEALKANLSGYWSPGSMTSTGWSIPSREVI